MYVATEIHCNGRLYKTVGMPVSYLPRVGEVAELSDGEHTFSGRVVSVHRAYSLKPLKPELNTAVPSRVIIGMVTTLDESLTRKGDDSELNEMLKEDAGKEVAAILDKTPREQWPNILGEWIERVTKRFRMPG